jgi:uncharacterized protein (TIGR03437 family)
MMRFTTLAVLLSATAAWASDYGQLPLSFEANQGQTARQVQFLSRGWGQTLFLTSTEAVLRARHDVIRMKLAGANAASKAEGTEPRVGKSNYFVGSDPAKWRTGVAQYGRVRFANVYPGIDVVYYGNHGQLEYDWVVKPGADPSKIRLRFEGVKKMRLDAKGDLVLATASGEIREKKPRIYQDRQIAGRYVVRGGEAAFEVDAYDRAKELVIDPVVVYASYVGGSGNDWGTGIAADSAGNAYVTGVTESTDFPLSHAFQSTNPPSTDESETSDDAFVAKISADGSTLIYSTFIGGTGADVANAIAVDSAGDAYITGNTQSTDFPLSKAFQSKNLSPFGNAFATKLNPAGSALIFSTYFGGSGGGADVGLGIAVDSAGNAYITGQANSGGGFPLVNPIEGYKNGSGPGAFVSKMSADGSTLAYSTFLGGYTGQNFANAIAVDSSGAAYVTGLTAATDFMTVNPLQSTNKGVSGNAFVAKLNPAGSAFVYATYLGGSLKDEAYGIAVDSSGNAYITGTTRSTNFPTANAYEAAPTGGAAFVSKINSSGSALVYSTYLGSADDTGYGIVVNGSGEAWVTGVGHVPSVNGLTPPPNAFGFVCEFTADGSALAFSTELFGTSEQQGGIARDASGNVYLTGLTGSGGLSNPGGFEGTFGGGQWDAFVVKIASGPVAPSISAVVNGASFEPGLVPGSWATIQGTGLSAVTDTWANFIVNGKLPTTVDGVSVTVGGQNAYVYYISAGQINFIVPEVPAGPQPVVVTNAAGTSAAFTATVNTFGPAFFGWPGNQVVATRQDFSLAAASGTFAGTTTTPAKPGDTIILWGTGFGPTNPTAGQGEETPSNATYSTETLPMVTIDNVSATVYGAALAPGFAGLYQVAIQVPGSLGNGDWPIVATIGGVASPSGAVLTVQQ